ncbi:MAG TPA: NAD(P)H-binding protein [Pseudonocardiaceae bacterium]|jgi:nucleoside-diphosphate-sugar epimerase|nr:NAD(P)H-binding protein [Pseudonocardiaceae bacterium]
MRVLVIGATGMIGRPAVRRLLADGHQVTGLARDESRAAVVAAQGATPVVGDLFDPDSLARVLPGHEAVLNLATRIPSPGKAMLGMGWAENDHVRRDGSAALVTAALAGDDVRVIVQEGITFYYADGGDTEITEESPVAVPNALRSSVEAHENVARFAADGGRVGVRLRIGELHGDDPMTRTMLRGARFGTPLVFGDRDGWTVVVHPSDAATGAVAALAAPSGIYNVAAPPLRKRDVGAAFAALAGVRKARAVPAGLLRMLGPAETFARSQRVVSTKLTETTGWRPRLHTPSAEWLTR